MFINKESVNFNCVIKWAKSFSSTKQILFALLLSPGDVSLQLLLLYIQTHTKQNSQVGTFDATAATQVLFWGLSCLIMFRSSGGFSSTLESGFTENKPLGTFFKQAAAVSTSQQWLLFSVIFQTTIDLGGGGWLVIQKKSGKMPKQLLFLSKVFRSCLVEIKFSKAYFPLVTLSSDLWGNY